MSCELLVFLFYSSHEFRSSHVNAQVLLLFYARLPWKTVTSSHESMFEMNLKKKCSYHYKIMLLLKNAK